MLITVHILFEDSNGGYYLYELLLNLLKPTLPIKLYKGNGCAHFKSFSDCVKDMTKLSYVEFNGQEVRLKSGDTVILLTDLVTEPSDLLNACNILEYFGIAVYKRMLFSFESCPYSFNEFGTNILGDIKYQNAYAILKHLVVTGDTLTFNTLQKHLLTSQTKLEQAAKDIFNKYFTKIRCVHYDAPTSLLTFRGPSHAFYTNLCNKASNNNCEPHHLNGKCKINNTNCPSYHMHNMLYFYWNSLMSAVFARPAKPQLPQLRFDQIVNGGSYGSSSNPYYSNVF